MKAALGLCAVCLSVAGWVIACIVGNHCKLQMDRGWLPMLVISISIGGSDTQYLAERIYCLQQFT